MLYVMCFRIDSVCCKLFSCCKRFAHFKSCCNDCYIFTFAKYDSFSDLELIVAAAKETGKVVTVEEHSVIGGLGSAVCDVLSEKLPTPVLKIGVMDTFGESGPAVELIKKYGLDADSICEKVKAFVK